MTFHPKYPTPNMDIFTSSSKKRMSSEKKKELEAPVDPSHNNGILYVQIHQAMDLEIGDPEVLPTNDEFKHPYDPSKVVNPYAVLYIDDNKVFQTREKLRNPSPVSLDMFLKMKKKETDLIPQQSIGTLYLSNL